MKEIVLILDGMMEASFEHLNFPQLLFNHQEVDFKWVNYHVKNQAIDSLNCIMNLLGYSPNAYEIGDRAFYELLAQNMTLAPDEVVLRCNVIEVKDNKLTDFTGGELPKNLDEILSTFKFPNAELIVGQMYKNLLVLKRDAIAQEECFYPPHFHLNEEISTLMPKSETLQNFIEASADHFKQHQLNHCLLWPWGISERVNLPSFEFKHQKVGGMISGIDLVHGMGLALKMKSIKPEYCNGYETTNLTSKLRAAIELLDEVDVLIVHINGLDELAHVKDLKGKLAFLNRIKDEFITPLINHIHNTKLTITCDHRTDSLTGTHEPGSVFWMSVIVD